MKAKYLHNEDIGKYKTTQTEGNTFGVYVEANAKLQLDLMRF